MERADSESNSYRALARFDLGFSLTKFEVQVKGDLAAEETMMEEYSKWYKCFD